jgi:dipeptidyl aminopeptidase/acylaminoacyl peptidase
MHSLIVMLLCLCALSSGWCAGPAGVRVNGISLVPLRAVAEWLGMKVGFDRTADAITLSKGKLIARLILGSTDAEVDGAAMALPYPVHQRGDQTYVPARLFDALNVRVGWDAQEHAVLITPPAGNALAIPVREEKILYRTDLGDRRGNSVICSMDPDGGNVRRLTDPAYHCGPVTVSPDGELAAFICNKEEQRGIYAMRADGAELRLLFASETARSPCYSADGRYLYYLTDLGLGRLDADGGNQQGTPWFKLTKDIWKTENGEGPVSLAALRDGRLLVSVRFRGDDWDRTKLYLADYARRTMTPFLHGEDAGISNPDARPDGARLAFQRFTAMKDDTAARLELCIMNADGSDMRAITGEGDEPAFSQDGTRLAFTRHMDIYLINLDGTGPRRLTDTHAWESGPRWALVR